MEPAVTLRPALGKAMPARRAPRGVYGLLLLATLTFTGCLATRNCDPCEGLCPVGPECFGYYPTCWRPWPCPHPCPSFWEEGMPGIPLETIPDPVPPEVMPEDPVTPARVTNVQWPMPPHVDLESESEDEHDGVVSGFPMEDDVWPAAYNDSAYGTTEFGNSEFNSKYYDTGSHHPQYFGSGPAVRMDSVPVTVTESR